MASIRRLALSIAGAGLLIAGCTSITIPSIPPIPTIPPIDIPTLPPFEIPSGLLPSVDPASGVCALVTAAEMSAIMGAEATITSGEADGCSYTLPSFAAVVVSTSPETDFTGPRFLFGDTATDLTVGGFPAVSGVAIGQPAVYVQKPTGQLSVLGVLTGADQATMDKLVRVANTAIARMP